MLFTENINYVVGYLLIGCLKCDRSNTISHCKTNYSDIFVIFLCEATEKKEQGEILVLDHRV